MKSAERIFRLTKAFAAPTLILRAGLVGGNFIVMMGLAWGLGLAMFGELMVLWAVAMVMAMVPDELSDRDGAQDAVKEVSVSTQALTLSAESEIFAR